MASQLKRLTTDELEMLYKAPLLVSILIAGADGRIDKNEINGGMSTAQKKAHSNSALKLYYQNVAEDFEDKLKVLEQAYSSKPNERTIEISAELSTLNSIFEKVDGSLASDIYESLKSLAVNIAKSSGGFLRSKIGPEEAALLDLKMIHPPKR